MSKRASQFQISKDRGEDDDINEDELNFANQKASDEVLAKRKYVYLCVFLLTMKYIFECLRSHFVTQCYFFIVFFSCFYGSKY